MFTYEPNWLVLLLTALVTFLLGLIWFSRRMLGARLEAVSPHPAVVAGGLAVSLVVASFLISHLEYYIGATTSRQGMTVAWWVWVGFILMPHLALGVRLPTQARALLVNALYWLGALLIMGAVLPVN